MPRARYITLFLFCFLALVVAIAYAQPLVDVPVRGTCNDAQDGDISSTIEWESDIDGPMFVGAEGFGPPNPAVAPPHDVTGTHPMSIGTHQITATCTDAHGAVVSATITHEVILNSPPVLVPLAPEHNGQTVG